MIQPQIYRNKEISHEERRNAISIFLIGESYVGKPTIINGIFNYARYINSEHLKAFKYEYLYEYSSALEIQEYMIKLDKDHSLILIDSPGLSDLNSQDENKIIQRKILNYIEANSIDFVCFVVDSQSAQLTKFETMMFQDISRLLTGNCVTKILLLLTSSEVYTAMISAVEEVGVKYNKIFKFRKNSLLHSKAIDNFTVLKELLTYVVENNPRTILVLNFQRYYDDIKQVLVTKLELVWEKTQLEILEIQLHGIQIKYDNQRRLKFICRKCQNTCYKEYYVPTDQIICSTCNALMRGYDLNGFVTVVYTQQKVFLKNKKSVHRKFSLIETQNSFEIEKLIEELIFS